VVVDAGNGMGGLTAGPLYRSLGFDVVELHCQPDGRFPNHHPDPTMPENMTELAHKVISERAELGIAFDGDADRIGVVDARGRILWGDQLMILFARAILSQQPGATFVGEVKCSQALYDEIAKAGGNAVMWKVGHSLIKQRMKELGAVLAGEMSGHIFFAHRYLGFDDGVYAGARLLELLSHETRSLAQLVDTLPVMLNTPEIRADVPDDLKFELVKRVTARLRAHGEVNDIDGARIRLPGGWGLVRASNTQPALVLRFEAESAARLNEIRALVEHELAAARDELGAIAVSPEFADL
jgi:phosphomannomutase/phosphoglucomutase